MQVQSIRFECLTLAWKDGEQMPDVAQSPGVEFCGPNDGYIENAIRPRTDWRSEKLKACIKGALELPLSRTIFLFPFDPILAAEMSKIVSMDFDEEEIFELVPDLESRTNLYLRNLDIGAPEFHLRGFFENEANKETLTWNGESQLHVGMHIDSFEGRRMGDRDKCAPRLSINIGESHRYFLFADIVAKQLLIESESDAHGSYHERLYSYFRTESCPTIWRTMVPANWAYMAPTENIPHEASSAGSIGVDRQCVFLSDQAFKGVLS